MRSAPMLSSVVASSLLIHIASALRVNPMQSKSATTCCAASSRVPKPALSLQQVVDAATRQPDAKVEPAAMDSLGEGAESPELIPFGKLKLTSPAHLASSDCKTFSLLSWNCLLPNSEDNWWCEKMYQSHVPEEARQWPHRQGLIRDRILLADADLVCIQEAAGDTFDTDFAFMRELGYEAVLHKKFRFRCATFYKPTAFTLQSVAHEDRALVTSFVRSAANSSAGSAVDGRPLYIANVHLSGGAAPDRRLRQVHGVTERVRKWVAAAQKKPVLQGRRGSPARKAQEAKLAAAAASPPPPPSVIVCGDFNSDGNTAVRRLLVEGLVDVDWREPQYVEVELTSKPRAHSLGAFADAGEVAYGQNVCDGDWGDWGGRTCYARYRARRPATYVVPSLASAFLRRTPASTNRQQVVADNAMLARLLAHQQSAPPPRRAGLSESDSALCHVTEGADAGFVEVCRRVFDAIDADRGGSLSAAELREALQRLSVRDELGEEASEADADAMLSAADADSDGSIDFGEFLTIVLAEKGGSGGSTTGGSGGGSSGWWARFLRTLLRFEGDGTAETPAAAELVRLETEADVEALISRFTPAFRAALDSLFDRLAAQSKQDAVEAAAEGVISEPVALEWLEKVNRELGRGGTYRGVMAAFEASELRELSRRAWYGVFARELGEGKWWQVAYDLEVSGVAVSDFELGAELGTDGAYSGADRALGASKDAAVEAVQKDAELGATRPRAVRAPRRHYEGWLDYVYYTRRGAERGAEGRAEGGLRLVGYQESLDEERARRIYQEGDALPNAWHPSDHLPVGCVFEWS